jgi:hypothetical protein
LVDVVYKSCYNCGRERGSKDPPKREGVSIVRKSEIVSPINFSKEIKSVPQYVYGLIREGKLESHKCECGHIYLLRSDQSVKDLVTKRMTKVEK